MRAAKLATHKPIFVSTKPRRESTFSFVFVAKEEKRENAAGTSIPAPNPKITYLPNIQNALKCHMHTKSTGLDMPTPELAINLTIRACYVMSRRKSAMPLGTCPVYPHL
eukprot:31625-Pelagomonas_calceolata.AAC.1